MERFFKEKINIRGKVVMIKKKQKFNWRDVAGLI
jgi:hypothetical protein